jgi:hypothetical protein
MTTTVIPAKAGTQYSAATPRGNIADKDTAFHPQPCAYWVPAFAGMTVGRVEAFPWERGQEATDSSLSQKPPDGRGNWRLPCFAAASNAGDIAWADIANWGVIGYSPAVAPARRAPQQRRGSRTHHA